MSDRDPETLSPDDADELLAAEFALGGLPGAEQAALARRADSDAGFARRVAAWDDRLAPLADAYAPVAPPAAVKQALDLRLFGTHPQRGGLLSSLAFWRGLTGALSAAVLLAIAVPALRQGPATDRLAATLTAEGSGVSYMAVYDAAIGSVSLAHLSGAPVEGRDYQLWIARGAEAPVSLGVIPAGVSTEVAITSDQVRALMTSAAHIAISLEPPGGSPTGQPTGPVLAVGDLLNI